MRREGDLIKINEWLLPMSWIYGSVTGLRNRLFDIGILKSRAYKIPVIAVGNITVGGTGKTPHVEYLIRLLQDKIKVAVLSRGYKRKSKGYVLADSDTQMSDIGDEPYQMMLKYPKAYIAVDKNRRRGIERLKSDEASNDTDVILLDDAYQHRYVKPGINILLVDYHRLIIYDKLLPAGRLRESMKGKQRADMVIITKCPRDLKPMEYRVLTKALELFPYQGLYFTTLEYDDPTPLFPKEIDGYTETPNGELNFQFSIRDSELKSQNVLLLTGIASPQQMEEDLQPKCKTITPLTFGDHHAFKSKDIRRINEAFESLPKPRIILTTEKDAARLLHADGLSDDVRRNLYVQPVRISFMLEQEESFNTKILSYVQKNSRNSILAKDKDAVKTKDSNHSGERSRRISFRDN
ncbi:MAG: tetraacyldisaccharide 4'-kinase [Prevotella sp.]|nr:tetraacyldisaccharide 4'-kinase [Prevotella sp.]